MFNRRQILAAGAGLTASAFLPRSLFAMGTEPAAGDGTNKFAANLYAALRKKDGNVFLSPYSISTALAMCAAGAKGKTLEEMRTVLCLPANEKASDEAYEKLAKSLDGTGKGFELAVANALWAQTGYPWANDYTTRVKDVYKASIHDVNFKANAEACRGEINTWVEKQTKDRIKDLMPSGSVRADTRLVLTNAIYFKGDWFTAFDKKLTKDAPFTKLDGTKKDVPLMHRNASMDYFTNDDVTAIKLPYKGKEISFIGVLPKKPESFEAMDKDATAEKFAEWTKALKPASGVQVWLPRFKVETSYDLTDTLQAMGMPLAFSDKADFTGMVTSGPSLVISIVVHKAFVDVNEEGTEAAAATGIGMRAGSPRPTEPKVFKADRPFLFALRHEPTGTLLFLGRYTTA